MMRLAALWAWVLCCGLQAAQAQGDPQRERQSISAERAAADVRFSSQEQACQGRFVVQACLDDVAAQRRTLERELKRREASLNAVDRQQAAQDQLQRSADKARDHQNRQTEPTGDVQPERVQAQEEKQRAHLEAGRSSGDASKKTPITPSAAEQASLREAYAAKQRAAQERRAARDKRLRESTEKPSALPLPK
ncbi:hypothetical protein [Rhodoferax sp.]|uniref:hypothetical protein n=1 Tax=Rhodoferax sp. TaxID=50421 RepID=UPI002ACE8ADB|nr:hypothetical protein [Rhodoferax sp.]MDZ7919253.1 hypothetical protein [Rhodoferax sp.]